MKKVITMLVVLSGFCFSQTGMVTDSGFGVWLNTRAYNIEYTDADPYYNLTLGYTMDNVLEMSTDY